MAANLNRSDGKRLKENTKSFALAMEMYGGKRICNLFELNYTGPHYEIV